MDAQSNTTGRGEGEKEDRQTETDLSATAVSQYQKLRRCTREREWLQVIQQLCRRRARRGERQKSKVELFAVEKRQRLVRSVEGSEQSALLFGVERVGRRIDTRQMLEQPTVLSGRGRLL